MMRYILAFILALAVHLVAVAGFLFSFEEPAHKPKSFKIPEHVQASLVVLDKPAAKKEAKPDVTAQKKEAARRKAEAEKKARAAADKKKKQEAAKKKAEAEKKARAAADKKKKQEAAKKKAEAEKKAKAAAEKKKQQEAARKKAEAEKLAAAAEEDLLDSLDSEDEAISEAEQQRQEQNEQNRKDEAAAITYQQRMNAQIQQQWTRPPSARNGMEAEMEIHLLPTGELQNVYLVKSSGDQAFDRSVERAIRKVKRFQVPDDARLFEKYFRTGNIVFRPEDLLR